MPETRKARDVRLLANVLTGDPAKRGERQVEKEVIDVSNSDAETGAASGVGKASHGSPPGGEATDSDHNIHQRERHRTRGNAREPGARVVVLADA